MDPATLIALATKGFSAAMAAADLYKKAKEAAENDNMEDATRYLEEARSHYAASREAWDAAGS